MYNTLELKVHWMSADCTNWGCLRHWDTVLSVFYLLSTTGLVDAITLYTACLTHWYNEVVFTYGCHCYLSVSGIEVNAGCSWLYGLMMQAALDAAELMWSGSLRHGEAVLPGHPCWEHRWIISRDHVSSKYLICWVCDERVLTACNNQAQKMYRTGFLLDMLCSLWHTWYS